VDENVDEAAMEPYDLEQVIREEMKFVGLSGETSQQRLVEGTPDLDAAAREIELAIDALRPKHPYDLPTEPDYMFDPDYAPDHVVLVLAWPMPEPF
jgi:hypothetical protein